ncbi:hypothetical protein ACJIZ3_017054 [Penstemon smallii]|uniref:Glutathione S-transferase n=1 Tax=Penstemon smallii TaxID=265156 RepID=A0ABD3SUL7_9LAMI
MEVKLLGHFSSPFVQRVKWALKIKGVEYDYCEEDVVNKSPQLLKLNPVHNKVPVLIHNGKSMVESLIILEYIDETWKTNPPLLPQDPYQRAMTRFWAKFVEEKFLLVAWEGFTSQGVKHENAVKSALEKIEGELLKGKKKFFGGGETIGYLDLVLGCASYNLPAFDKIGPMKILDPLRFPAMDQWINNFRNHPIIKGDIQSDEELLIFWTSLANKITKN